MVEIIVDLYMKVCWTLIADSAHFQFTLLLYSIYIVSHLRHTVFACKASIFRHTTKKYGKD